MKDKRLILLLLDIHDRLAKFDPYVTPLRIFADEKSKVIGLEPNAHYVDIDSIYEDIGKAIDKWENDNDIKGIIQEKHDL